MNVTTYPPILDSYSLLQLKNEVEHFAPLDRNKWIGIHDEPENTIEKYIQDSFDFNLSYPTAVGFEWWIQIFTGEDGIPFHDNHDEGARMNGGEKQYPLTSTITYLTNSVSPTIILNADFPPTEVVFSVPEEGKFLTCDPKYIRGVHPNNNKGRMTLCYDVWHYRPIGLDRVGLISKPVPCRFYKQNQTQPVTWLGKTKDCTSNLHDKMFTFNYPTTYREGETWKVIQ
jgi:hypothetical protein